MPWPRWEIVSRKYLQRLGARFRHSGWLNFVQWSMWGLKEWYYSSTTTPILFFHLSLSLPFIVLQRTVIFGSCMQWLTKCQRTYYFQFKPLFKHQSIPPECPTHLAQLTAAINQLNAKVQQLNEQIDCTKTNQEKLTESQPLLAATVVKLAAAESKTTKI